MNKIIASLISGFVFLPLLAQATPPSLPYGLGDISVNQPVYRTDENAKPITALIYNGQKDGTTKKFTISYSLIPYKKVDLNSDINKIKILLNGLPLDFSKKETVVRESDFPSGYSEKQEFHVCCSTGTGEYIFAIQVKKDGAQIGSQSFFIIIRGGLVSISGADFSIAEWQLLMHKYGLSLNSKVDDLPISKKQLIQNEYREIRHYRQMLEDSYDKRGSVDDYFWKIKGLNTLIPAQSASTRMFITEGYVIDKIDYPDGCPKCPVGVVCDLYCPNQAVFSDSLVKWNVTLEDDMIRAALAKEANTNAGSLVLNAKYSMTVRVSSTWQDPKPRNVFEITSIKLKENPIDGLGAGATTTPPAKKSFFGRMWGWFAGLFR